MKSAANGGPSHIPLPRRKSEKDESRAKLSLLGGTAFCCASGQKDDTLPLSRAPRKRAPEIRRPVQHAEPAALPKPSPGRRKVATPPSPRIPDAKQPEEGAWRLGDDFDCPCCEGPAAPQDEPAAPQGADADRAKLRALEEEVAMMEPLKRELEQEREMRLKAEWKLRQRAQKSTDSRGVQTDEGVHAPTLEDNSPILFGYESRVRRYQAYITKLEKDNLMLVNELKKFKDLSPRSQDALLEKLGRLERDTQQQQRQYESCLDEVANRLVHTLLAQKRLEEECKVLHLRVEQLEHENRCLSEFVDDDKHETRLQRPRTKEGRPPPPEPKTEDARPSTGSASSSPKRPRPPTKSSDAKRQTGEKGPALASRIPSYGCRPRRGPTPSRGPEAPKRRRPSAPGDRHRTSRCRWEPRKGDVAPAAQNVWSFRCVVDVTPAKGDAATAAPRTKDEGYSTMSSDLQPDTPAGPSMTSSSDSGFDAAAKGRPRLQTAEKATLTEPEEARWRECALAPFIDESIWSLDSSETPSSVVPGAGGGLARAASDSALCTRRAAATLQHEGETDAMSTLERAMARLDVSWPSPSRTSSPSSLQSSLSVSEEEEELWTRASRQGSREPDLSSASDAECANLEHRDFVERWLQKEIRCSTPKTRDAAAPEEEDAGAPLDPGAKQFNDDFYTLCRVSLERPTRPSSLALEPSKEGCGTAWVHLQPKPELDDPEARVSLLDSLQAPTSSSSEEEEEEEKVLVIRSNAQLHRMCRERRQRLKASSRQPLLEVGRRRPSVAGRRDLFFRFGEQERAAIACFDFLEAESSLPRRPPRRLPDLWNRPLHSHLSSTSTLHDYEILDHVSLSDSCAESYASTPDSFEETG